MACAINANNMYFILGILGARVRVRASVRLNAKVRSDQTLCGTEIWDVFPYLKFRIPEFSSGRWVFDFDEYLQSKF